MKEKTGLLKNSIVLVLLIWGVIMWFSDTFPQGSSNGTIDLIFKPQNGITQFAIWMEDNNGKYIGTVYITNFIGRRGGGNRTSDTNIDSPNGNRLSALPIWAHKRGVIDTTFGIENYYPPAETQSSYSKDIDAVSSATPKPSLQRKRWKLSDLPYGEYKYWIEANQSFDFNPYHNYSWYRGQPSVVWNVSVMVADSADSSMVLDYIGYGSPDGSDGKINPPDSTITTAANLLVDLGGYRFKVVYSPTAVGVEDNWGNLSPVRYFYLDQNYPNPFNSSTVISFQLPMKAVIKITAYDILGQEIHLLVNEKMDSGIKKVVWDGKNNQGELVPSGLYFYKMEAGNYTNTRKMLILR